MIHGPNPKATVLVIAALCLLSTINTPVTHSLYADSEVMSSNFVGGNVTTTAVENATNHTTTNANETAVEPTTVSPTTSGMTETTLPPSTTTITLSAGTTTTSSLVGTTTNETTDADPITTRKAGTENDD